MSCLGKVVERMVASRLMHILEKNDKVNPNQAGFRPLHSTEDQTIRLFQLVHNGFQNKPPERTVLALLDFSKEYDRVFLGLTYDRALTFTEHTKRVTEKFKRRKHVSETNGNILELGLEELRNLSNDVPANPRILQSSLASLAL